MCLQLFNKTEKEGTLLTSFYGATIILMPESDKDTTNKIKD